MSKFCPMCGQVTNCTENCKDCIEEEKKENESKMITVGSRVKYIRNDDEYYRETSYYPPIGTLGTVVQVDSEDNTIEVEWDSGTMGRGIWWCNNTDVEVVL